MNVELALKINRLVHDECKDVPHDIGIRIEELVRLHQSELKTCTIPHVIASTWVFFYEGEEDKPQFKVQANAQWEAYQIAQEHFGPQVEEMMYKML